MTRTVMLAGIGFGLTILGTPSVVTLGAAYSFTFKAFGGVGPFKFTETGSLPSGLTFTDNGNGTATLAGTTSAPGNYPIAVTLSDSARTTVTASYTLAVQALPLSLSGHIAGGPAGVAASGSYTASGGIAPYTFAVTSGTFPTTGGLSTAGAAQGNWSTAGNYSWQVTVTDSASVTTTLSDSCTNVVSLLLTGSYSNIYDNGDAGSTAGSLTISGGSGTYSNPRVTAGSLPTGLTPAISGSTLVLNGTTSAYGSFTATVAVDSSDGQTATKSVTIIVGDPNWSHVIALLHFDGTNGSTTMTDVRGHTFTASSCALSTAASKFGPSSLNVLAGGGGSGGSVINTSDVGNAIGAGDFTIRLWMNCSLVSPSNALGICTFDAGPVLGLYKTTDNKLKLYRNASSGYIITSDNVLPTTWTHIQWVRSSGTNYLFVDGTLQTTTAAGADSLTGKKIILCNENDSLAALGGYMDDFEALSYAVTTSSFTPPTRAYQNGGA